MAVLRPLPPEVSFKGLEVSIPTSAGGVWIAVDSVRKFLHIDLSEKIDLTQEAADKNMKAK